MRIHSTAILGLALLSACLDPGGAFRARGDDARAARILKDHGLERQRGAASSWVLAEEATVLKRFRMAKELAGKLAAAREAQQDLEMGGHDPRALAAFYQAQIDMGDARISEIDRQLASLGPSVGNVTVDNWHNLLVQERNAIVGEQRRLQTMIGNLFRQGGAFQQQKRQFHSDVAALQDSSRKAVDELRRSVEKIFMQYAELGKDGEIAKALADLSAATRMRQKLGPSNDLQAAARWLDSSRRTSSRREHRGGPRRRH
jgi:hypothetical protein